MRLLIHQSQAGCIIGRAGFKIKELREVCCNVCDHSCRLSSDPSFQIVLVFLPGPSSS